MAKDKENKVSNLDDDFFSELLKDTDFKVASVGSLMHSRDKVKTPLLALNCIYGGGIPLGIISEISGSPGAGKSTFLYQCMGNYQRQYPHGIPVIYDMEASMDNSRLKTLGVNPERVLRLPATSMEEAFENMFKMLNKLEVMRETRPDISSFQIYDSLAAGGTSKQHAAVEKGEQAFGQGTMMEPQRIMKQNLANVLPYMEKFPVFLGLINQVITQINGYGGASVGSGGGFGLKHLCHAHIFFGSPKDEYDRGFMIGTNSEVQLKKSKLSPKIVNIPCYIDATKGGVIDEADSLVKYLINLDMFSTGAYYKFGDYFKVDMIQRYPHLESYEDLNKIFTTSHRKAGVYEMIENDEDLRNLLQIALIDYIDAIYPAQREVNYEYEIELMNHCKYFSEYDTSSVSSDMNNINMIAVDETTGEVIEDDIQNSLMNSDEEFDTEFNVESKSEEDSYLEN